MLHQPRHHGLVISQRLRQAGPEVDGALAACHALTRPPQGGQRVQDGLPVACQALDLCGAAGQFGEQVGRWAGEQVGR